MKKYKLTHFFIYRNYVAAVFTDNAWEIICSKYYVSANGQASTPALAETAAKTTIDGWVDYKSEKQ